MGTFIFIFIEVLLFVVCPLAIAYKNVKVGKVFKWVLYLFTIAMIVLMLFPLFSQAFDFETSEPSVADGFEINKYTVKLDVDEKQKVEVEEDITVNWTAYGHHGILKFTPEWLRYTSKSGKTIRRKSTVSDLRAEIPPYDESKFITNNSIFNSYSMEERNYRDSYKYTTDIVNDKPRIKIGDSNVILEKGEKDYIIKYTYDMGSDPYEGYDEFIFHTYGDFWGTEIKNPSIEITMPKSIEDKKVKFFMDKYRKYDVTDYVDYTISENKLVANFNNEKYQKNRKSNYPKILDKALTVDIELPDNYFENGSFNYGTKSLTSIIISLIIMIVLFILWFIFGKDYDKKAKVVSYMPPRDLSAAELGYIDSNEYSKKLVVALIVELAAKKMIKVRESEDGKIYIKGIKPSKKDKDYKKELEKYDKMVEKLNPYEQIVIKQLIKGSSEVCLKEHKTFYTVFEDIEKKLDSEYKWVLNEKVSYVLKYLGLLLVNVSAISMILAYRSFEDLPQKIYNLYYVGFGSVFISLFLSFVMTRKSKYGEDITVEVSGFKEFLNLVEKDKLEELVEEMPDYFYQILPYTYVLNLSRKWIEKFEDISMPEIELKDINMTMFDDITNQVYTPSFVSSGSSSSSGCSSCGGGCSSCGGGCSSCGGGSSW